MGASTSPVIPVEYTMRLDTFPDIGGHVEAMEPVEKVLKKGSEGPNP
jgi:hypothetical protein